MSQSHILFLILTVLLSLQNVQAADRVQYVENTGDVLVYMLPVAALSAALYKKDAEGTLQYGASLTTSLATTFALKYTIDAERPNGENSRSFPSGHSSTAFVSATYLQMRYGYAYGVPAYALATFVAWSRVYSDHHYTRDVIAGSAIGIISAYIFTTAYEDTITVSPIADNGIYGISLNARFTTY